MADYTIQTAAQLSSHLRSLRKNRGLTQAQLGAIVGVDQTRIAKIEGNPGLVSVDQLLQVIAALGANVSLVPRDESARAAQPKNTKTDW